MAIGRDDVVTRPEFVSGDLFPPRDMGGYGLSMAITKGMCMTNVTKRFVFDALKIEALRVTYEERKSDEEGTMINNHNILVQKRPHLSRIAALSAFLWSCFIETKSLESEKGKNYVTLDPVNIRPRCDPPLGEHSFENYYTMSVTIRSIKNTCTREENRYGVARKIGEKFRRVDKDFVKNKIQEKGDDFSDNAKKYNMRIIKGEVVDLEITSLCRFPLYEADFGFGKSTWVSSAARGFVNLVALLDNKAGDGIEAYISLKQDEMAKLEVDKEFLAFVSPNSMPTLDEVTNVRFVNGV